MSPQYKKPGVCACPAKGKVFKPAGIPLTDTEKIVLYTDEFEAMKHCDLDGLTQEEAGSKWAYPAVRSRGYYLTRA